ncbi:MAG TPA: Rossmann fold nucleotide-binding protein [Nocardioidaceae bacterium]|nr:Rossmann fold nucleotide-binding protein [Nocardioidaceae bacterium]
MKKERGRTIELETLEEFDERVAAGATSMAGWHLQTLDLSERGEDLRRLEAAGALFLGCSFADGVEADLSVRGALIFPVVPDVPVNAYRGGLYSPQELYDGLGGSYENTPDARIYAWSKQPSDLDISLAKALHDHSVDDALRDLVVGTDMVGMMGGHALQRGSAEYADAARLAHALAGEDLLVCTGGGPGAMEAANLGAYLAGHDLDDLAAALDLLAGTPGFRPSTTDWARAAFAVLERWPDGNRSVGIPTWHYGHEPPNAFASSIAKYFKNAIREDILLHLCVAGIVFLPGAGGTVQEIFQDACENYYADRATVAPMVLVGREYWTEVVPAWPLLRSLAQGRAMEPVVHLVDDLDEVGPLLARR